jgi:hypothetical protein
MRMSVPRRCSALTFDPDFVLTNVMTYWLTRTGGAAARLYYENAHAQLVAAPTTLPTAVAGFGGDFYGIRRLAQRDHQNIVRWTTHDHGGHDRTRSHGIGVGQLRADLAARTKVGAWADYTRISLLAHLARRRRRAAVATRVGVGGSRAVHFLGGLVVRFAAT